MSLVTSRHVSDATIERMLGPVVDDADELSQRYFRAGFVSGETMRLGIAMPLHPAAERFYRSREAPPEAASKAPGDSAAPGS